MPNLFVNFYKLEKAKGGCRRAFALEIFVFEPLLNLQILLPVADRPGDNFKEQRVLDNYFYEMDLIQDGCHR